MFFICVAAFALFAVSSAFPAQSNAVDTSRSRYAILSEFYLSGVHNVRWETTPMKYLDAQGKPMEFGTVGGKSMSPGCVDILGKAQQEGVEYERANGKFKYKCTNGNEEVIACIASDRANKARIEVGRTLDVNGFWHKCESYPNGSVIYTQETSCTQGKKEFRVGEEVTAGFLRLQCQEHGYKVVGCVYLDENNKIAPLNIGEKKKVGKVTHACEERNNTLQYYATPSGCSKQGKEYEEGETFNQNHLHYKCGNGIVDITGCYINDSRDLGVGQDVVENHMVYRCYRIGGKIEYNEYACGYNGTPSCKPEPIPQTPDDVPALGRGLMSPGFSGFAAVQEGDGNKVVWPSTMKLQLDKAAMGPH